MLLQNGQDEGYIMSMEKDHGEGPWTRRLERELE
jgi:hypothetical protein